MANSFSIPQSYGERVDTTGLSVVNSVLAAKQQRYDYNLAKIDSTLAEFGNIQLARTQDKEYLQNRINGIMQTVGQVGKLDLTDPNVTRQIQQSIGSAIDDNVIQQIANTKKILNFEQSVAQKREKNPELYSDVNYTYAKKRAGVEDYMRGYKEVNGQQVPIDNIGDLRYDDYYDIDKNLREPLEKWAKELGYQKYVSEDETSSPYFKKVTTGEVLTQDQIAGFLNSKINSDPKLVNQIRINADYAYSGLSDNQFRENYLSNLRTKKDDLNSYVAKLEEQKKNIPVGSEEISQFDASINSAKEQINQLSADENSPTFNRDAKAVEVYTNGLFSTYQKTYARNNITDIKYDDTPLQIAKFEYQQYKDAKDQVKKEAGADLGLQYAAGDSNPQATTPAGDFTKSFEAVDTYLKANDPNYANADEKGREAIRREKVRNILNKNITAQGYSAEEEKLIDNYWQQSQTYQKGLSQMNNSISGAIENYFNGMKTSARNINLDNLAETLPTTARLLRDAKVKDFKSLSPSQKEIVRLEMADNLKNTIADTDEEKKHLTNYVNTIQQNAKNFGRELNYKPKQEQGYWSNWGDALANTGKYLYEGTLGYVGAGLNAWSNRINDPEKADLIGQKQNELVRNTGAQALNALDRIGAQNLNALKNDRDLSQLESDELSLGTGVNIKQDWKNRFTATKTINDQFYESVKKPLGNVGISYNPTIKEEQPITQKIAAAVIANGGRPDKNSAFQIEPDSTPGQYRVIYDQENFTANSKGGQTKSITPGTVMTVKAQQLPPQALSKIGSIAADAAYDYKNPTPFEKTHVFTVPKNSTERKTMITRFMQNNPDVMSPQDYATIMEAPFQAGFGSAEDYNKFIQQKAAQGGLNAQQVQQLQGIANTNYFVEYEKVPGVGYLASVKMGSKDANTEVFSTSFRGINYDPTHFTLTSFKLIDQAIKEQINNYVRTANQ